MPNNRDLALAIIHQVFGGESKKTWPYEYKKSYIREINADNALKRGEFPQAAIDGSEDKIIPLIEAYDRNYETLLKYQKAYELLGTKNIGLYHLREITERGKARILTKNKAKNYDFIQGADWQITSCSFENNKAVITVSKHAFQPFQIRLSKFDFSDGSVWHSIEETAERKSPTGEKLLEVRATLTEEKRWILTVKIDLDEALLEIGNDISQADEDGNRITPEIRESDRRHALAIVAEYFELEQGDKEVLIETLDDQHPVINKNTETKLHTVQDKVMLIVRISGKYHAENPDEKLLNEDADITLPNQKLSEIMKDAAQFYDGKGTFEGFFEAYPGHKTDEGKYTHEFNTHTELYGARAYALIISPIKIPSKNEKKGYMKGKMIESIGYHMDMERGEVEVRNGSYSESAQKDFINRIIQIDKQARARKRH